MTMSARDIPGIHHITALARDPRTNVDFYTRVLGLRLVKKTVNFDDPGTYHLYYGDDLGRPGTIMTFFPWLGAAPGVRGIGQATVTAFQVPEGSLGYWAERFERLVVDADDVDTRFGQELLAFRDPDGLALELVAGQGGDRFEPWGDGPVPDEHAIRGFMGLTLTQRQHDPTARFLTDVMGFELLDENGDRLRLRAGHSDEAANVEILGLPGGGPGRISAGTVHHVAWRVAGDEEQRSWSEWLRERGVGVTEVRDRNYFRSIYFREPGGVLFEIATDPPGFTADESPAQLGQALKLPSWLEPHRERIEEVLPPLQAIVGAAGD